MDTEDFIGRYPVLWHLADAAATGVTVAVAGQPEPRSESGGPTLQPAARLADTATRMAATSWLPPGPGVAPGSEGLVALD